jgi:CubicO group peptidase (beta-lactamase class C family)
MTSSRRPVLLRSSTACLALGGLLLAAPAVSQPSSAPTTAAIDAFVAKTMAEEHMAAASIAIVKDGKVVLAKGYGLADREKGIQATAQTVYQIGSLTKSFTAAAVLMLVEEGRLSLEAKVTDLVAGLPAAWSGITVRHLLNQTSGIADYPDLIYERKIPWPRRSRGMRSSRSSATFRSGSNRGRSTPTATAATTCSASSSRRHPGDRMATS